MRWSCDRADAIHFAAAVFTNLTQDHLDFHPTMEDYFAAKRRLFAAEQRAAARRGRQRRRPVRPAAGAELDAGGSLRHVRDRPRRRPTARSSSRAASPARRFTALTPEGADRAAHAAARPLQRANVLGAVAAVRALGVPLETIAAALPHAGRVPGRFEPVDEGQPFAVLVDYAHTPDSLRERAGAARELTRRGACICVFGCGGDRDRGKRPLMGEIAARLADRAIVTSDNPRSEDPEAIVAGDPRRHPGRRRSDVGVEVDRRAAIAQAIAEAADGDVVVIAGKGHEQGQELAGGEKVPFDDVTVAREALRAAADRRAMRELDARAGRRRRRARGSPRAPRRPTRQVPRASRSTRATSSPATSSSACAGETHDGGRFAAQALAAGAWGVLVAPAARRADAEPAADGGAASCSPPTTRSRRCSRSRAPGAATLGAPVIAITGSTGKTSTKDILAALLAPHRRTFASRGNFNTEIGLPLELLAAPAGTEALVLEMGMRGAGQIAELAAIAEPDVGVIVNVGPAHLELLGSVEAIAAAKAELIADLHAGATAVIPAGEPLLDPHRRADIATVTFGPGGDVTLARQDADGDVDDRRAGRADRAASSTSSRRTCAATCWRRSPPHGRSGSRPAAR